VWAWMDGRIEGGRIGCGASASAPSLCRLSLALLRVGDLPPLPGSCVCVWGPRRSLGHPERVMLRPASFSGLGPAPSYNKKEKPSPLASRQFVRLSRLSREIPLSPFASPQTAALSALRSAPTAAARPIRAAIALFPTAAGACSPDSAPTRGRFRLPVADLVRGGGEEERRRTRARAVATAP
jgi:hypothetical protein